MGVGIVDRTAGVGGGGGGKAEEFLKEAGFKSNAFFRSFLIIS